MPVNVGGARGNRPPPPRDLYREGYAGANSQTTMPNAEWMSSAVVSDRTEQEYQKSKTKSDARRMVANMVAERLALCGISAASEPAQLRQSATPARGGGGACNGSTAAAHANSPPAAWQDGLRTPAAYVEPPPPPSSAPPQQQQQQHLTPAENVALLSSHGATTLYRKPAVNAVVSAAVSQALNQQQHQQQHQQHTSSASVGDKKPVWRHAGNAPPPKAATPASAKGPRAWHTREELVSYVEEATKRAELAEDAADGARLAFEMLQEEVRACQHARRRPSRSTVPESLRSRRG